MQNKQTTMKKKTEHANILKLSKLKKYTNLYNDVKNFQTVLLLSL